MCIKLLMSIKESRDRNLAEREVQRLERENGELRLAVSRLSESNLMSQNRILRSQIEDLQQLQYLNQSEIVRLRRTIELMEDRK